MGEGGVQLCELSRKPFLSFKIALYLPLPEFDSKSNSTLKIVGPLGSGKERAVVNEHLPNAVSILPVL